MSVSKTMLLPGGGKMPTLGLGTWTAWEAAPGTTRDAVKVAIEEGYRLFDCAWLYENENEIGEGIQAKIADGTVKREDLFVTTKLWCNAHRRGQVINQMKESLRNLKLDHVDLYLVHWPTSVKEGPEKFPVDENGKHLYEHHDIVDTWKGMEDMVDAGLAKNIGISNFNSKQVQKILDNARIKPVTNQIEIHPYLTSVKLVDFCHEKGITITAYSPFCNPTRPWTTKKDPVLLEDPVLTAIAASKKKTPAQVSIRFLLQRGLVVIPKSVTPSRIRENIQVYDFELSDEEMERIFALDKNFRAFEYFAQDHFPDHPEYPFNEPF